MIEGRPAVQSQRTAARESFFLDFARELRKALPKTILMVTGGFRSRIGMEAAVAEGACDIIGIGRPAILYPSLPLRTVLNSEIKTEDATIQVEKINPPYLVKKLPKSVGSGYESVSNLPQITIAVRLG
jgi:2,4-dienoyl-CoA reductase-like NADH-dependent reductase (Old Yellow Enzyme family)